MKALLPYILTALLVVPIELGVKLLAPHLSANLREISSFPQRIKQAKNSDKEKVIFIGNSLVGNAVDTNYLSQLLGPEVEVLSFTPDGTGIWDWFCLYQKLKLEAGQNAQRKFVLGFAWTQLSDLSRKDPKKLGGLFCDTKSTKLMRNRNLWSTRDQVDFYLSKISTVLASSELIRKRILALTVPFYRENAGKLVPEIENKKLSLQEQSYELLELLLETKHPNDSISLVAMPVRKNYEIDRKLLNQLEGTSQVKDLRVISGLNSEHFVDPIHLGAEGSRIFTKLLATKLD